MEGLAFEWRLRWAIWRARRGDCRALRTLTLSGLRKFAAVMGGLTAAMNEAKTAFTGLAAAWDALPEATKEEMRRLDVSP